MVERGWAEMRNFDFAYLMLLPSTPQAQVWLKKRMETLSVRENYILAAAATRRLPENMADAIDHIQSLDEYSVCFPAGSYEELGEFSCAKVPGCRKTYCLMWIWSNWGSGTRIPTPGCS